MKRMEENRENKINKEAATIRENNGKASRIAKNILAAGLAAGGVAAFGDMSVFAAGNEGGGTEVTKEQQTDAENPSVDISTDAVSVDVSEPVASEPIVTSNDDGSQTTTETVTQTTTTYYVDPSTIGDYENVNENPGGENRTHLYDQETTVTTTTTTTESSSEENVDVSGRENEAVEDIARDVAGDTDKDGNYNFEKSDPIPSEDGNTTTVTEKGTVTDTESTFDGNTTITTTTTSEVVKTTTTEKSSFINEEEANNWANAEGYTPGSVISGQLETKETEKKDYLTKDDAEKAAVEEAKKAGLNEGDYTINPAEKSGEQSGGGTVKVEKEVKEEAKKVAEQEAAKEENGGFSAGQVSVDKIEEVNGEFTSGTVQWFKTQDEATQKAQQDAKDLRNVSITDGDTRTTTKQTGEKNSYQEALDEARRKALENGGTNARASEVKVANAGSLWDPKLDDDIEVEVKPKANWDNLYEFNYITTDGDLELYQHTRGSVYVNGNLEGNGRNVDNTKDNETVPESTTSYVNGEYSNVADGRGNKFVDHVQKDEEGSSFVQEYWCKLANKIASLSEEARSKFRILNENDQNVTINGEYTDTSGDTAKRDGTNMPIYVYLGDGNLNLICGTNNQKGFYGILIAPKATVSLSQETNWCGTIIGKTISTHAEAHIWEVPEQIKKWIGEYDVTEYSARYEGYEKAWEVTWSGKKDVYKGSYTVNTWDATRESSQISAKKTVEKVTKSVTVEKSQESFYGDRSNTPPEVPDVPTTPTTPEVPDVPTTPSTPETPTTPGTPETPGDPITPVSEERAVLGVQRPQEIAEAAPSGGAVLGATRGRQVATGDEANVLASAALAGASGTSLGGFGLFRRLRNRRNRRNR